ncbi:delta-class carbonic anhydrase [Aliidiomarina celeris]|uniref:delta-class carbonic anhydrase n=1 Tax=Aliidiomarina celeris TaxID=2249428 RepID=UPI000DE97A56|nr:delta-class carbonic anhydrase [Aliidiomarina celeris]
MRVVKLSLISVAVLSSVACASQHSTYNHVDDSVIAEQRAALAANTEGKDFGPQSPRDLETLSGNNTRMFNAAPSHTEMNLCNIHFHVSAEHRGGEFTTYAGNGDGQGHHSGYVYNGRLPSAHLQTPSRAICEGPKGGLKAGDTIEVHYVFTSALITPGPTLAACFSESTMNPQLRVESQVYVLVSDEDALDFQELTAFGERNGYQQALNIPSNTGTPIRYAGSTTGHTYNTLGSPLQVSWSVRPKVAYVNIESVGEWCDSNPFNETTAHGVRNLVVNPDLISDIEQ